MSEGNSSGDLDLLAAELKALEGRLAGVTGSDGKDGKLLSELAKSVSALHAMASELAGSRPAGNNDISMAQLKMVLDSTAEAMSLMVFDPDPHRSRIILCNDPLIEMSGHSREQLLAARNIDELTRRISVMPDYDRRKAKNLPRGGLSSWLRPDGKENYFEWRVKSLRIDGRNHLLATCRDVTKRVVAERNLTQEHAWLDAIVQNSSDGISVSEYPEGGSGAWRLVMCNDRYVQMTGRTREELMSAEDARPFSETLSLCQGYGELRKKNLPRGGTSSWNRPDGRENYCEWRTCSFQWEGRKRFITVHRDVTDRILTERELERQRAWLEAIIANSVDGITIRRFAHDRKGGQIVFINDLAIEMSGRTRKELMSADDADEFTKPISLCADYKQRMRKNLPRGGVSSWIRPDGKENYFEWRSTSMTLDGIAHIVTTSRDITERVLSEREVESQRTWLQALMDNSSDGILVSEYVEQSEGGSKWRAVMCNEMFAEIAGRTKEDILAADDLRAFSKVLSRCDNYAEFRAKNLPRKGMATWDRPDGKDNYVEWTTRSVTIRGKKRFIGIHRDVTDRIRSEKELEKQRALLQTVLENAADGMVIRHYGPGDPAGKVVLINDRAVEMSGRTRQELLSVKDMRVFGRLISQWADYHKLKKRNLPRGGLASWIRPDGKENYYEWRSRSFSIDGKRYVITVSNDVTDRIRSEKELETQRRTLEAILANSSDGVTLGYYEDGRKHETFVYVNERFVEMTGYSREQLLPMDEQKGHARSSEISRWPDYDQLKAKNLPRGGLCTLNRPDGRENYCEWRSTTVVLDGKRYILTMNRDVTERVRAERALKEATDAERLFRKRLEAMHEVNVRLGGAESVDELCLQAVELGRAKLGFDRLSIWFVDPDNPDKLIGAYGTDELGQTRDERSKRHSFSEDRHLTRLVEGHLSVDIEHDSQLKDDSEQVVGVGQRAVAPLLDSRDAIGFMQTDNLITQAEITGRQVELLTLYASAVGHLVTRKRAEHRLVDSEKSERSFRKRLEALHEVEMRLCDASSVDDLCRMTVSEGTSTLGFERMGLWLASDDDPNTFIGSFGTDEQGRIRDERALRYTICEGDLVAGIKKRRAVIQTTKDVPLYDAERRQVGMGRRCIAPMWDGRRIAGYISVDNLLREEPITDQQAEVLMLFAAAVGHLYTRKRTEQALKINQFAIDSSVAAIAMCDMEGKRVYANPAFIRMWRYKDESEAIGSQAGEIWQDRADAEAIIDGLVENGQWSGELVAKRMDGTSFPAYVNSSIVRDAEGNPVRRMASMIDMTERKRLENEVLQAGIAARRRVGQDLHDSLGQVLTGVAFLSKVLDENLTRRGAPEAEDASKIAKYVDESIELTRLLSRGLQPIRFSSGGLVQALTELTQEAAEMFAIRCDLQASEQMPECDDITCTHVYHIIQEAISNAARHGNAKTVTVRLRLLDTDRIELMIADDGEGMPDKAESKGMGMRTMRYRASAMGGSLSVHEAPGGGTKVTCIFNGRN